MHCIKGQAKGLPHKCLIRKDEDGTPTVPMDYMYMLAEDNQDKEDKTIRGMPILVIKDNVSGYIAAQVVLCKGECGHAIELSIKFLDFLGYKRVVLKSDQEDNIKCLKDAIHR